jgi:hypothetical protein
MAIKKSEVKKIEESAIDPKKIVDSEATSEIENTEEIEIEEIDEWANDGAITAAGSSLKANSMPVGPANKAATLAKIMNALAVMDAETINNYAKVVPSLRGAANAVSDNSAKNRSTITTGKGGNKGFSDIEGVTPGAANAHEETEFSMDEDVKNVIVEEIANLFEGEDLKPEFKEKVSVIIESITNLNTAKRVIELEEEYETALLEQVSSIQDGLVEGLNVYLDAVIDTWMNDNEVAIVSTLKSDLTEQFVDSLRELFETHYITIPDDRIDVVEELASQVEDLKKLIDNNLEEKADLKKELEAKDLEIEESKINAKIAELSEGLSDSDAERFVALTENVEYENLEDFTKKAVILKETVYKPYVDANKDTTVLFEETEILDDTEGKGPALSESIASYVKALDKFQ